MNPEGMADDRSAVSAPAQARDDSVRGEQRLETDPPARSARGWVVNLSAGPLEIARGIRTAGVREFLEANRLRPRS
jgi:hypothetical protein